MGKARRRDEETDGEYERQDAVARIYPLHINPGALAACGVSRSRFRKVEAAVRAASGFHVVKQRDQEA